MASTESELPPSSNGVNGHSFESSPAKDAGKSEHAASTTSPNGLPTPERIEAAPTNAAKNADSFAANQSAEAPKSPPREEADAKKAPKEEKEDQDEDTRMSSPGSAPVEKSKSSPSIDASKGEQTENASSPAAAAATETVESKQEDVDMVDAPSPSQAAATTASKPADEPASKTSDAAAASTTTTSTASVSSLLPSLRNDDSKERSTAPLAADTIMAVVSPNKVARGREEDGEEGRSAKRAKTDDLDEAAAGSGAANPAVAVVATSGEQQQPLPVVAMPARTRIAQTEGSLADPKLDGEAISAYANREIRRVLASVKKTKAGHNFKDPVHKKWPMLWDAYRLRVVKPVDIGQIERNLRESVYVSHGELIEDLHLIFENSVTFNGIGNTITDEAKMLVDNIFSRLSEISAREPQKAEKKDAKQLPTRQTEPRAAASRRESRGAATSPIEDSVTAAGMGAAALSASSTAVPTSSGPTTAGAGTAAAAADTPMSVYAVPSSGVPIIRRDSAKTDGDRPKRPIHPPKNRDLGYEPKNPKKKQPEFRFCEDVLKELMKAKHYEINHWFLKPVDPVAMQIPTYHKVIKKPMDLGTMQTKLNLGEYSSAKEFESDVNLIIKNCRKFNVVGEVVDAADRLEALFRERWAEKDSWIAAHTTQPLVHSPVAKDDLSDDEADDSDLDGAGDDTAAPLTSDAVDALVKRLEEETGRLTSLFLAKLPDMAEITMQQTLLGMIQKQILEEKAKLAAAEAEKPRRKQGKAAAGSKSAKSKKQLAGGGGSSSKRASLASGGMGGGGKKAAAAAAAAAASGSKKFSKTRVFGQAEKNVVTDGINNLEGQQLERAIDIIKKDTNQEESESGELELDIDQLSQDALGKLYDLIVKAFPHMKIKAEKPRAAAAAAAADAAGGGHQQHHLGKPSKPKKHKPMGKLEQERNIEKLREIKAQFQRPGSGSQEPLPSVEVNQPRREDESEDESEADSEEE